MAMESATRVMNGTFGDIWEDGNQIAEVSAFQVKVTKNFDTLNLCRQMAEDRKLIGVKITGSMTLHRSIPAAAMILRRLWPATTCGSLWLVSWPTPTPTVRNGWPFTASATTSRR